VISEGTESQFADSQNQIVATKNPQMPLLWGVAPYGQGGVSNSWPALAPPLHRLASPSRFLSLDTNCVRLSLVLITSTGFEIDYPSSRGQGQYLSRD
jgi:hypothetical protein